MAFKHIHFIILLLFSTIVVGQVQETNPPDYIKTIIFKGLQQESQLPILRLGEPLILEFDALNGKEEDFYYVIEHFNYDWSPSPLVKSEYLSGFDNQRILNYENSFNTYQIYSHYNLKIPNQQTKGILKTGNYVISIWNDNDQMVFSRKFMVYENSVNVGVSIKMSKDVKFIEQKQSVDIVIGNPSFNFNNPMETVKIVILQNSNLNTAITDVKPQYILGNQLTYKYVSETSFWGGNEYRYFENKDVRAANVGVQFIDLKEIYHNYLFANSSRANSPYTYNPDINGNFVVTALDKNNVSIEADYTMNHFKLYYPFLKEGQRLYVYGNYNNYALDSENELRFSDELGLFQTIIRMKQGFYNYKYVIVEKDGTLNEGAISGNYWQTENNYKVLVYYKNLGARYDQLIGVGEGSSLDISN